ncbi:hypothetical protein DLB55_14290 [Salmonella enterica subsp. enterica]|nr:hypothetical protein [Salmonella enterica subsp. enterica]
MNNKLTDEKIKARINAIEDRRSASRDFWDGDWDYPEDIELLALRELQERRKADSEPVALRWRWNDNAAQWTYAPASKMPEFVAAGFSQNNGVEIEYLYAAPQPALQPSVGFVDATGTDCECVCPACKHEFSIQFEY